MIYANLINKIKSENWEEAISASDEFVRCQSKEVVNVLIDLLNKSTSFTTINAISLALREIKDNRAVKFLIQAIKKNNNYNISTIVYSLENLNCKNYFFSISLLFIKSQNFDTRLAAYNILNDQEFKVKRKEIKKLKQIIRYSTLTKNDKIEINAIVEKYTIKARL